MRRQRSLTLGVLIAVCACLVVTVSAQKAGKPAPAPSYDWEATLVDPASAAEFLSFPSNNLKSTLRSGGNVYVGAGYTALTGREEGYSTFTLRVLADSTSEQWIGFKNIGFGANSGSPKCNFPVFDVNGVLDPRSQAAVQADCIVSFLNDHHHPQAPYWMSQLNLRVPVNMNDIPPGHSVDVTLARMDVFVSVTDNTNPASYSSIGNQNVYLPGVVKIGRSQDGNSWTTDVNLPLALAEVFYVPGGKRWQTVIPSITTTQNITSKMIWTRSPVQ